MKLSVEQINARLEEVPSWTTEDHKWIVRKYRFAQFLQSIQFVNDVARLAEANNHHPMIAVDYRMVTLRFTSWSAGGLTELDFSTAKQIDLAYPAYLTGASDS